MAIKSEHPIYKVLEHLLRESDTPLTSVQLWDAPEVREHAKSAEKVSDHLGLMWRRGLVQRWTAPKDSLARARYAYTWIDQPEANVPKRVEALHVVTSPHKRANVTITEEKDRVVLDFEKFTLIVQAKG